MANFIPSKKVASDFNNGTAFKSGDVVQAETMNNVVEGVLYSQNASDSAVNIANSANDTAKNAQQTANEALEIAQQGGGGTGGGAVTSVNGKIGAVTITKTDIGLENVDNERQYSVSNPPPYPVTSVNSQTGAVTISKYNLDLAEVAITGSYSDLEDKPEIPSTEDFVKKSGDTMTGRLSIGDIYQTHSGIDFDGFVAGAPSVNGTGYYAVYGNDYINLIYANKGSSSTPIKLTFPTTAGTFALRSDIPEVPSNIVTSVNGSTGAVTVSKYDLGLPTVALTGSYNDLEDKPDLTQITVSGRRYTIKVNREDAPLGENYITFVVEDYEEEQFTINVLSIQGINVNISSPVSLSYGTKIQLDNGAVLTVVSIPTSGQYACTSTMTITTGEYKATIIGG